MPDLDLAIRVRADLQRATRDLDRLEKELRDTGRAGRQADAGARRAARGYERARTAATRAGRALTSFRGALAGVGAVLVARQIVDAGLAIERLEQRFRAAAGGAGAARAELEFVREQADRLGINFRAAANAYSGFLAASRGTRLEGQASREVFLAVAEASRVMGLSAEQTDGALLALEQIMSKGKVSAEELRGQLGERLPGAFQIAARAMGVTTAELDEMLVAGELMADEFLPRFARELRATVAEELPNAIRSQSSAFEHLGNAIDRLAERAANSGLTRFFADLAEAAADAADAVAELGEEAPLAERRTSAERAIDELRAQVAQARTALGDQETTAFRAQVLQRRIDEREAEIRDREIRAAAQTPETLLSQARAAAVGSSPASQRRAARLREDAAILNARRQAENDLLGDVPEFSEPEAEREPRRRERAARDVAARIVAIRERAEDRLARLTLNRIALVDHAEQRQLGALERNTEAQLAKAGENEGKRLEIEANAELARTAIVQAAEAERGQIREEEAEKAVETARRLNEERERAVAAIENAELDLATPFERAVVEAERWRDATLDALDETDARYGDWAKRVEAVYLERVSRAGEEAAERQRAAAERATTGFEAAYRSYTRDALDANDEIRRSTENAFRSMEDVFVQFVTTGKFSFSSLADSILADLARIAARQAIGRALSGLGLFGGGASIFGGDFSILGAFHGGGIAGRGTRFHTGIDPSVFAAAPRLHQGGIAGDEVPAILRRGEGVFTPEQMRAIGGAEPVPVVLRAEIENRGGSQAEVQDVTLDAQGREWVIGIVIDDMQSGGRTGRAVEQISRSGGF